MNLNIARIAFALVCVFAVGSAIIRVATASDRVKERRELARSVCTQSGGEWIKVDDAEICRRADLARRI